MKKLQYWEARQKTVQKAIYLIKMNIHSLERTAMAHGTAGSPPSASHLFSPDSPPVLPSFN